MESQVIFKVDKKLKDRAMKRAQDQGVPFASVLKMATRAFADGHLNIGLFDSLNQKTLLELTKISKDIAVDKNLSPRFSSVKDIKEYLEN